MSLGDTFLSQGVLEGRTKTNMTESKRQGIYILGNDNIIEDAIAFLNSLRQYAPHYPVLLIPYDDQHQRLARLLRDKFGVEKFEDQSLFDELDKHAQAIHGKSVPAFRKFACWFGPFDEFIYFDNDIVVFQDQTDVFDLLAEYDIVYCGDGRILGIDQVFTKRVLERNLFSEQEISELFNTGFFASKKGGLDRAQLMSLLEEAATVSDIFFPQVKEQGVLNYLVLGIMPKRANLRDFKPAVPDDAWAGVPTLEIRNDKVLLPNGMPVRNIHWAGFKQIPNRPYVSLWLKYRYPGRFQGIQIPLIRLWWLVSGVTQRLLHTHIDGWYRPAYQIRRIRRIVSRLLT
jgi:hypothetical protein